MKCLLKNCEEIVLEGSSYCLVHQDRLLLKKKVSKKAVRKKAKKATKKKAKK